MSIIDYLQAEGLIDFAQIEEAQFRLSRWGGSIEDHIYSAGEISEFALLEAIAKVRSLSTVELSQKEISWSELELISGQTAWDLKILPIMYDEKEGFLKIACTDPENQELQTKLSNLLPGKKIQLLYAIRQVLEQAIIKNYRSSTILSEHEQQKPAHDSSSREGQIAGPDTECALFLMPESDSILKLADVMVNENYTVVICQNIDEAKEEIRQRRPSLILVQDDKNYRHHEIEKQCARFCPSSQIRIIRNVNDLFRSPIDTLEQKLLLTSNLHLVACAMATSVGKKPQDAVIVGPFSELICRKLGLSTHHHMVTVCVGYLQDIARLYFRANEDMDRQTMLFQLLTNSGDQFIYPPSVLNVTRHMYAELGNLSEELLHEEHLRSANIVSAADFVLTQFEIGNNLSTQAFENILQQVKARVGTFFLPEVAESLLQLLDERTTADRCDSTKKEILILDELGLKKTGSLVFLESNGFECTAAENIEKFLHIYKTIRPEFVILAPEGKEKQILQTIEALMQRGITYSAIPTFVISSADRGELTSTLLKLGIQDVISCREGLEILLIRIRRILENSENESKRRLKVLQDNGTHGSLEHMNLIDLLQAIGVTEKSVRISVTGNSLQLTIFLDRGKLTFAECDDKFGAEAVFEAIGWTRGLWSVDHIKSSELPESNNTRSIDSILIEGVHYLDELALSRESSDISLG